MPGTGRPQAARLVHAMTSFGDELRRFLAERGMTLREAARRAHCDSGYLSKIARGERPPPGPALAAALDRLLRGDGALVAAAQASRSDDIPGPEGRARLAHARHHPHRISAGAVDALAAVLAVQRRAEDALGSAAVLPAVAAQLKETITPLVIEARGPVRPAVVEMAAQWAQYAGWLHASQRQSAAASSLFDRGLEWAVEVGSVNLISEIVSMKGQLAWIAGQPGPVIGLSQAAQRGDGLYPGQVAISAAQEARGHAMAADAAAAERTLGLALERAEQAAERRDEAPPWLYYHSDAFWSLQRGLVYRHLAHDARYYGRAVQALSQGHAGLPADQRFSDWGAVFLYHLAAVHAQAGDTASAAAVALEVAAIAHRTASGRLLAMLGPLHRSLGRRYPADAAVASLGEALR